MRKIVNITILASLILYMQIKNKPFYYALAWVTADRKLTPFKTNVSNMHSNYGRHPKDSRKLLYLKGPQALLSAFHIY